MKASELTQEGFYWCSHDLGMFIPPGKQYPVGWDVVEATNDGPDQTLTFWVPGGEIDTNVGELEGHDYVQFLGPIPPPPRLEDFQVVEWITRDEAGEVTLHRRSREDLPEWAQWK